MDSEATKQIIIAFYAIENACEAMLKPAILELQDGESVAKMPKEAYDTYENIKTDCRAMQRVLSRMADYVGDMEVSLYDDSDIKRTTKIIKDLLFDVPTISTSTFNPHSMFDVSKALGLNPIMDNEALEERKRDAQDIIAEGKKSAGFTQ